MTNTLPEGLTLRAPSMDDAEAVTQLIVACDIADFGEADTTVGDLLVEWGRIHFNLATDASVVVTPQGRIVGYTDVCERGTGMAITPLLSVHPDYRRLGLERYLLHLSEERARQYVTETGSKVRRVFTTVAVFEPRHQLLEQEGYTCVKVDWRMEIVLDQPPQPAQWPQGFIVRTFVPGQDDRIVHKVIQDAFSELGHRTYVPFDEWKQYMLQRDDFDPRFAYVVEHEHEIIGAMLGYNYPNEGWVRQLAVSRPWRRHGVGRQLLRHAFYEFYRYGKRKVGLAVDSENPTGAPQFYTHMGMHAALRMGTYEKDMGIPS